jgi:hypothetical protein
MSDDEEELNRAIVAEFEWGRRFLAADGHPGAVLTAPAPDLMQVRTYELGGRFGAKPDRRCFAVLELDPGRIGWRIEASLSICPDDRDRCETIDLGSSRTVEFNDAIASARLLARRAIVGLRDDLEAHGGTAPP